LLSRGGSVEAETKKGETPLTVAEDEGHMEVARRLRDAADQLNQTRASLAEPTLYSRLARLQAQLGASSRSEATSLAFRGLAAVGSR